ncbi:MAG: 16S rRNA (cytosine(1402)-N(4))-methyltransferase RsmH [Acholeplasmatales bacterium]|nr:16S rRNA (cytosine(1402)-N(4))-methyltransferase RsmH [Acholeplasmatales bacterium]
MEHITVLLNEAIEYLNIKEDGIYVDCTLGGAGHSSLILSKLKSGHLYSFDQDDYAISVAKERLDKISNNYTIIKSNFVNIKEELEKLGVNKVDGILYDLGVSSFQFDDGERGFSYNYDAKLDMRMDQSKNFSAYSIINEYDYDSLVRIFYMYGEEPFSKQIAKKIIENRPINTTFELVDVIKKALPNKVLNSKGHPAKRIFQALRIEVNDELKVFEKSLNSALDLLNKNGRVVVISFHSLEDRICKTIFKDNSEIKVPKNVPLIIKETPKLKLITKHPITPSDEEINNNNRSHSAKMRVAEKN